MSASHLFGVFQVRTLRAAVVTKDKALAKGSSDLASQQERAVKAEREPCQHLTSPLLYAAARLLDL